MVQDISRTDCSRTAGKQKKKGKEKKKNKSINNMHVDKLPEQWKKSISGRSSTFNTDVAKIIK